MRPELVDVLGVIFWLGLFGLAILRWTSTGAGRSVLWSHFQAAGPWMMLAVVMAGVGGWAAGGRTGLIGNAIGMALWSVCLFLLWASHQPANRS